MSKMKHKMIAAAAGLLVAGISACSDGSVALDGSARVTVLLTDAPYEYVATAMVDIGAVELIPSDGGGPVLLTEDGTDGPVDLLTLQNAATQVLADAEVEAGTYAQLRLIVESASVTLVDGYQFEDGSTEKALKVPSGAQTGIKLLLDAANGEENGGLEISGEMVLVIDFDVSQSFVIQGNPETPAGIKGMIFKPTLRVVVNDVSGTIAGTVSTALANTRVDSLTVTATPLDAGLLELFQSQTATTRTDAQGDYTLRFVVPGTYSVKVAVPTGLATQPDSIVVSVGAAEDVVDVDFTIVSGS